MSEITMIPIKELHPHKDNPRKQLGDIKELTESIRKNGIMQNLTVVPGHKHGSEERPDGYTIIIGHRRCAAARAAGLTEVPCMISDMDERQQLCTMMEENMQREDLTVPEQAYGFQYMIDLGVTAKEIAQRTGFAESTVKHRLEIAKLDKEALKTAFENEEWQMTLRDLQRLEEIKNTASRNEILKGCKGKQRSYFEYAVSSAIQTEKRDAAKEKWMPLLEKAGVQKAPKNVSRWSGGWKEVKAIDLDKPKVPKTLTIDSEDYDPAQPLYMIKEYGWIYLLQQKEDTAGKQMSEWERKLKEEREKTEEMRAKAKEAIKEMQQLAVNTYYGMKLHSSMTEMETAEYIWDMFRDTEASMNSNSVTVLSPLTKAWEVPEDEKDEYRELIGSKKLSEQIPIYFSDCWNGWIPVNYDRTYDKRDGKRIMTVYNGLQELYGFKLSDTEFLQILNGTHEFYKQEGEG